MGLSAKWGIGVFPVILITILVLSLIATLAFSSLTPPPQNYRANPAELLAPPNATDWKSLEQFAGTLTRQDFESRLYSIFDPTGAIYPFLDITDQSVKIYSDPNKADVPVAEIPFALGDYRQARPSHFRSPSQIQNLPAPVEKPLADLRIVVDPADIGGKWAMMENRSVLYKGFGEIREGDLNLKVAKILAAKLEALGATVFLTHTTAEPVSGLTPQDLLQPAAELLTEHPRWLPQAFLDRSRGVSKKNPRRIQIAAETLLTKTVEARARAEKVRQAFQPDITIVLQHDATSNSGRGRLARLNRNVFFIHGAYTYRELTGDPRQRLKMLTKLLENVTPVETTVADYISNRFICVTGFPPVRYGDSTITRSVLDNPYVVARNLLLNREHDGPVVVVEPYFMNEAITLQRLLEGDYEGSRLIAGEQRPSIYREYADAVTLGLLDAYGYRMQKATASSSPQKDAPPSEPPVVKAAYLPVWLFAIGGLFLVFSFGFFWISYLRTKR